MAGFRLLTLVQCVVFAGPSLGEKMKLNVPMGCAFYECDYIADKSIRVFNIMDIDLLNDG